MPRKRKGIPLDGWLVLNKPVGVSSAQAVAQVRRATNAAKLGHGGTLDPLADGVLPLALGEATKTVSLVMDGRKTYHWQVRWGQATSTDDREGEVTETSAHRPDEAAIRAILPRFVGEILQTPPIYSALKVDGNRAYDLARRGEEVTLKPRPVWIERLELLSIDDADHATFAVDCGKGTYVRALARDVAHAVGTVGHVTRLCRTACGPFHLDHAISLDKLAALGQGGEIRDHLWPIRTALDDIPALALSDEETRSLRCGATLAVAPDRCGGHTDLPVVCAYCGEEPVALARLAGGILSVVRGFNCSPS